MVVGEGSRFGDYQIEIEIGRGGMGIVYKATQVAIGRTVALKLMLEDLCDDQEFRQRFIRESRIAASIDHPNVIPVHDAGEREGRLFIAMRYVDGTDLAKILAGGRGGLPVVRAIEIVRQVAAALDCAHGKGLVHRDVKPGNVLVCNQDGEHVYLTDFGLTRLVEGTTNLTSAGRFVGTLAYSAPEQIQGTADRAADVYALGCVLFEMLTGRLPFERDTGAGMMIAHLNEPAPDLAAIAPAVPAPLAAVVARALAKSASDRFASAGELARAATAAAYSRAAPAGPPSSARRPRSDPGAAIAAPGGVALDPDPPGAGSAQADAEALAPSAPGALIAPPGDPPPARGDDAARAGTLAVVRRRRALLLAAAAVVAAAVAAIIVIDTWLSGQPELQIYSSWPQQRLAPVSGSVDAPAEVKDLRTRDMERAARLALRQAGGRAGEFDVVYEPLDDSDAVGESPAALVQANAKRAAQDDRTAVYIGDFTSGATQQSIPILSRARTPQISVSSTRVGLTREDPRGDVNEPVRYYPPQPGYPGGYRNFVRIIPTAAVHARALIAVMKQNDGCRRVAMINDNSAYGEGLAEGIRRYGKGRVSFAFNESVGPYGRYRQFVDQAGSRSRKPDCFVYSGTTHPNTVEIFEAFAEKLGPAARLYGTNGVAEAIFFDPRRGGLSPATAAQVKVMVPPRDNSRAEGFDVAFKNAYNADPDPYAVYAYEAMQLALQAIADSRTGKRADIRDKLFGTEDRQSVLGRYSITSAGDTSIATYGISTIEDGNLAPPKTTPRLRRLPPT